MKTILAHIIMRSSIACLALESCETVAARTVQLKDWTGRGFLPDLVQYAFEGDPQRVRLFGPEGKPVAFQVASNTLSFVAELPAGQTVSYTLHEDGAGELAPAGVRVSAEGDALVLANDLLAVRVPGETDKVVEKLPPPMLAFRSGARPWCGGGGMKFDRPVKTFRTRVLARGPVFAEVAYDVEFIGGGFYRARVRVTERVPFVRVVEDYDLGVKGHLGTWALKLSEGWQPEQVEFASVTRNGTPDTGRTLPLGELGATPSPLTSAWAINPDNAWGPKTYFGLSRRDGSQWAGLIPLAKGHWRRFNALEIHSDGRGAIALHLPVGVRNAQWAVEVTSDSSPFSTGQHDPSLPATYGRREWGLMLAPPARSGFSIGNSGECGPFGSARLWYGCPSLDTYKDYVLEWPDAKASYPRVFHDVQTVAAFRAAAEESPLRDELRHIYALSKSDADAQAALALLKKQWRDHFDYIVRTSNPGHGQGGINYLVLADNLLAWPGLSAEDRREIRARMALLAYLTFEPDIMAWHAGTHMGNPNMPLGAYGALPAYVALLPDHPLHAAWKAWAAAWLEYGIGRNSAPGGAWFEYGEYGLHGFNNLKRGLFGLYAMNAPNRERLAGYAHGFYDYMLNCVSPVDPRYRMRILPGEGNSSPRSTYDFFEGSGLLSETDAKLAANILWAWQAGGAEHRLDPREMQESPAAGAGAHTVNPWLGRPGLVPVEPKLESRIFPGYGVMFRAHQGPDETFMMFHSGYSWSHHIANQASLTLYSKGAVAIPGQPYQYYGVNRLGKEGVPGFAWLHDNCVRFGQPDNKELFAWPDANILAAAFGPNADYAHASTGYPEGYKDANGPFTHDRQIVFMKGSTGKSPNYFVVRDTVSGPGRLPQWWNMNLIGRKDWIRVDGRTLQARTATSNSLDLIFADGDPGKLELAEDEPAEIGHRFWAIGDFGKLWHDGERLPEFWIRKNGAPVGAMSREIRDTEFWEQHVLLRIPGPPGGEFFYVIYPRSPGEKAPVVTRLAAGALKVETGESTDHVFLSTVPLSFNQDGIEFTACVGAVRAKPSGTVVALLAGAGRVACRGAGIESETPVERALARHAAGIEHIAPPRFGIASAPALVGHSELAPGIRKAVRDDATEYLVTGDAPVQHADGNVSLNARRARVFIAKDATRIVVADSTYACITAGSVAVRGCGPFDLTFTASNVTGSVEGETRTLVTSLPPQLTKAMYRLDGLRHLSGIPDTAPDQDIRPKPRFAHALGVTAGRHTLEVCEWTNPGVPPEPPRAVFQALTTRK